MFVWKRTRQLLRIAGWSGPRLSRHILYLLSWLKWLRPTEENLDGIWKFWRTSCSRSPNTSSSCIRRFWACWESIVCSIYRPRFLENRNQLNSPRKSSRSCRKSNVGHSATVFCPESLHFIAKSAAYRLGSSSVWNSIYARRSWSLIPIMATVREIGGPIQIICLVEKIIHQGFRSRAKDALGVMERIPYPQSAKVRKMSCKHHDKVTSFDNSPPSLRYSHFWRLKAV